MKPLKDLDILVVGGGGREHGLVRKLYKDKRVRLVHCAPGNSGISKHAKCWPIEADDIAGLHRLVHDYHIDLTMVGPEAPLVKGIVDVFMNDGLTIFGPNKDGALLEGSKIFCTQFLMSQGVRVPQSEIFNDPEAAIAYVLRVGAPLVVKADGLAQGKGVLIAQTTSDAVDAINRIMVKREYGDAGRQIVIQEFLTGTECSYTVITDGERFIPLATAQDYKRSHDDDHGINTGGMGSYSPMYLITPAMEDEIQKKIVLPAIQGMQKIGHPYRGVLYFGLMITPNGPVVLEINCRFGDPEIQVILARLKTDLADVLLAAAQGDLKKDIGPLEWSGNCAVCIVAAMRGYPGKYPKGLSIENIHKGDMSEDAYILHAGTAYNPQKQLVTSGGRVLNIVACGKDFESARTKAYSLLQNITFGGKKENVHFRKDIALNIVRA